MNVHLIIGGASKSGTTALYDMLKQSDDFFLPAQKELHYFSSEFLSKTTAGKGDSSVIAQIPKSLSQYLKCFSAMRADQVGVDISPSYLFHFHSAEKIGQALPDAKIVFILRRPDQKVFSQYVHLRGEGREELSFEKALEEEEKRQADGFSDMWLYRRSGLYSEAIDHFQQVLGKDRVKVILYEDFLNDPNAVVADICHFVGVTESQSINTDVQSNASGLPKSVLLAKLIGPNPVTNIARKLLPQKLGAFLRGMLRDINRGAKPVINPSTRDSLRVFYETDISKLETLIGRSTGWRLDDPKPTSLEKD